MLADNTVYNKRVFPKEDIFLKVGEQVVRPFANADTGPFHIVLPPVNESAGKFVAIHALAADLVNTVTIVDRSDSEAWNGPYEMDGGGDQMLFFSDGRKWWVISQDMDAEWSTPAPNPASPMPPTTYVPGGPTTEG